VSSTAVDRVQLRCKRSENPRFDLTRGGRQTFNPLVPSGSRPRGAATQVRRAVYAEAVICPRRAGNAGWHLRPVVMPAMPAEDHLVQSDPQETA